MHNIFKGGKDHASARYVYICLSPITRFLFPKGDDCLLDYLNEDRQSIELTWYMPTIPMVLVNSSEEASERGIDPKETIARNVCDVRILLFAVAAAFIYIQIRLFGTQFGYANRLAAAVESKCHCTSEIRLLIDQISTQQKRIVSLEEKKKNQDQEYGQFRALVHDLERKGAQNMIDKLQVPVAAVVVMACNRPNYHERTIESILKYQCSVASKFPLFISQEGPNENVKHKALTYNQVTYMQHLDFETVPTERPRELIVYYKITSHCKWALDRLFYKHNFTRAIILEDDMEISPDFFDYFEAAATPMDKDRTIMAVSSWNDNGQKQFVHDLKGLYRSDLFPGLGWMLTKVTWDELSLK
ncbi:hypothetical protein GIB67_002589 [Kingdonia uniflora]|uniref:Alpha-1,3-mannosyl-glycoprotein 2-beta-N-acetylglucosaminyltransferase n=1 Tax=Kingdonia uniflora TaxID=39325 RepID=A0A7J7N3U8_9MAGN|nr:hypothetical protein GIB67_002589 [Kingdonia uniflora]